MLSGKTRLSKDVFEKVLRNMFLIQELGKTSLRPPARLVAVILLMMLNLSWGAGPVEVTEPSFKPARLFTDNMVLQRDRKAPVWGWAKPGQKVYVEIKGQRTRTTTGKDGRWLAKVGPFSAGGPYEMTLTGDKTIVLHNVMVGDVWLASGQSNMEWPVRKVNRAAEEMAASQNSNIRLFLVPPCGAPQPLPDVTAEGWSVCGPQTVGPFSAVGYFFGRNLQSHLSIPIGLITSAVGGTYMESWTPLDTLKQDADFKRAVVQYDDWMEHLGVGQTPEGMRRLDHDYSEALALWQAKTSGRKSYFEPPSSSGTEVQAQPDLDTKGWKTMEEPVLWEWAGLEIDGSVWFRRDIHIPSKWAGKELILNLGPVDDTDITFFNGVEVGRVGQKDDSYWAVPRSYTTPGYLVKSGRNVIAVRVFDEGSCGGFSGDREQMFMYRPGDLTHTLSLAGEWLYQVSDPLPEKPEYPEPARDAYNVPSFLYNAMIHPLVPYALKGVIWYQGENNAPYPSEYLRLSKLMIASWRKLWGQGDFPFLLVQLANYDGVKMAHESWPRLREAQLQTAQQVPRTGMVVTIDVGDPNDVHPRNKQTVGQRLALVARALAYGEKLVYSGPIFRAAKVQDKEIMLTFDQVGGGLAVHGDKLVGFIIAGVDGKFYPAEATIVGGGIIVSSVLVPKPVAVRYAWDNSPEGNLFNAEGLPASPFRTDTFPWIASRED